MSRTTEQFERWLGYEEMDRDLAAELAALRKDAESGDADALEEINDRFYRDLEFGTAGLRGVLGAGTNRMNIYTVRKAARGVAKYVNAHFQDPSVAIAYDSRINSELFAKTAADALLSSGVDAFLYDTLMPAPALAFAARHHHHAAGIMITASHNPSKYNGFKVYNADGCQITSAAAEEMLTYINEADALAENETFDANRRPRGAKLVYMKEETKKAYYDAVEAEKMVWGSETAMREDMANLSVVYTPLNGAGNLPVRELFERIGLRNVTVVKEQELPDGAFPTCPYPSPDKREAFERGLALCREVRPDLLLATDPDCDRVGVVAFEGEAPRVLTGNETGVLLLDFICQTRRSAAGRMAMPRNPVMIRTIVSSKMPDAIAAEHGVAMEVVLTGFKYIGETIGRMEKEGRRDDYIFGFEESCGYLSGAYVRDKDAVNAATLICQMAAWHKKRGKTLIGRLNELYEKHGYYLNHLLEFAFEGEKGMNEMAAIMDSFRQSPPREMAGKKVAAVTDYAIPVKLPKADVMEFALEDGSGFIARPSGTEPKLKIYIAAKAPTRKEAEDVVKACADEIAARIKGNGQPHD